MSRVASNVDPFEVLAQAGKAAHDAPFLSLLKEMRGFYANGDWKRVFQVCQMLYRFAIEGKYLDFSTEGESTTVKDALTSLYEEAKERFEKSRAAMFQRLALRLAKSAKIVSQVERIANLGKCLV